MPHEQLLLVEEKSLQKYIQGRNIMVCTIHEYKHNFNMGPSSRLHGIQPTGQSLNTLLQQSYYGYNSITHTQLVDEKSHP